MNLQYVFVLFLFGQKILVHISPSLGNGFKSCLASECNGNHLALEILNNPKADYGDADPIILKESLLPCSNGGLEKELLVRTRSLNLGF